MTSNINLLKRAKTQEFFKKKIKDKLNRITVIISIFSLLLSVAVFLSSSALKLELNNINKNINVNQAKLDSLSDVEVRERTIIDKLSSLEKIKAAQKSLDSSILKFEEFLPNSARLAQLSLSKSKFSLTVESQTLAPLNEFIIRLTQADQGGKFFKKIVLDGLSIDSDGLYRLDMSGEVI